MGPRASGPPQAGSRQGGCLDRGVGAVRAATTQPARAPPPPSPRAPSPRAPPALPPRTAVRRRRRVARVVPRVLAARWPRTPRASARRGRTHAAVKATACLDPAWGGPLALAPPVSAYRCGIRVDLAIS